jgi:uncharacterized protein (DUF305 family)
MTLKTDEDAATAVDDPVAEPSAAPSARPGYWLPAVLVLGLLLGAAIGYLIPRGSSPADNSAEAGFARDMSTHHTQAVEMGMIAYTRASNADVRTMARDIALTQQGQIGMMQAWLQEWNLSPTGSQAPMAWMPDGAASVRDGLMPGMATPAELAQLRTATGLDEDRLFLRLMIQHHLGGIHMAQAVVGTSEEKEVTAAAQLAIDNQQRELTDMQALEKTLGA